MSEYMTHAFAPFGEPGVVAEAPTTYTFTEDPRNVAEHLEHVLRQGDREHPLPGTVRARRALLDSTGITPEHLATAMRGVDDRIRAGHIERCVNDGEAAAGSVWSTEPTNRTATALFKSFAHAVESGRIPRVRTEPEPVVSHVDTSDPLSDAVLEGDVTPTKAHKVRREETLQDIAARHKAAAAKAAQSSISGTSTGNATSKRLEEK